MAKIVYEADEVFNWEDLVVDDPETVKLRDFGCRRKNNYESKFKYDWVQMHDIVKIQTR